MRKLTQAACGRYPPPMWTRRGLAVLVVAGLIAGGSLIGGFLGSHYGRRLSPKVLRVAIVIVGLVGLYRLLTV